jgi:NADH:ubiquinone oxidoreductase subunit H
MIVIFNVLSVLIIIVPILLAVAFITLAERKTLGAIQRRIGPNTVGLYGIGQPFADALKLLTKEIVIPQHASKGLFFIAPALSLILAIVG